MLTRIGSSIVALTLAVIYFIYTAILLVYAVFFALITPFLSACKHKHIATALVDRMPVLNYEAEAQAKIQATHQDEEEVGFA